MPPVQDIVEWPGEWVAAQMGWEAGSSASITPMTLPPFPGWQGMTSRGSASGTATNGYWSGVFSSGSSGPQGNEVWVALPEQHQPVQGNLTSFQMLIGRVQHSASNMSALLWQGVIGEFNSQDMSGVLQSNGKVTRFTSSGSKTKSVAAPGPLASAGGAPVLLLICAQGLPGQACHAAVQTGMACAVACAGHQ